MHRAARRQREAQGLLGAGLAALPVTAMTFVRVARAREARPRSLSASQRFADADQPLLVAWREGAVDDGASGALIQRRGDKGMPIAVRPANGDEAFTAAEAAAYRWRSP